MAQLININSTEFRRCNLSAIQSGGTWENIVPDANEIIIISTTNALTAGGSGNCDAYIVGNGTTAASALPLQSIIPELGGTSSVDGMTLGTLQNGAIDVDGGLTNSSSNYRRRIIPNDGYTRIVGHGSSFPPRPILAFYNSATPSAGSFISGIASTGVYTDEEFDVAIPNGTITIIVGYAVTGGATTGVATLYKTENVLENLEDGLAELQERVEEVEESTDGIEEVKFSVNSLVRHQPQQIKSQADFTDIGLWKADTAEINPSYTNYRALPLINVVEGQTIVWHGWQHGGSVMGTAAAIFCYDNDGLPYDGTSARINYDHLTTFDLNTGEFTFVIPANVSYIGLSYNFTAYPVQDGGHIIISEESLVLTQTAKELINEAVENGNEVGDNTAKYFLKGNSNIVYSSSKKLGIIAAGQSNIDGRNSYSDLPTGFVNPNSKVRFCDNTNGTFADFQVTDGGQDNDWSFDAIVYDLLTKTAYGNQSEIYVMKKSMGGTSIDPLGATNYHWTADYEFLSSEAYSLLRTFEKTIRKGIETQGTNFEIKALLWHQGEGDMQNEAVASRYYDNLKNVIAYIRGIVGNPRLYVFCGNISLNRTTLGFVDVINAAYTRIASEDPYFKVVDMSDAALEDGYHFNYQWSIYFGQKVYDLMIDAGLITGTKINPSKPT